MRDTTFDRTFWLKKVLPAIAEYCLYLFAMFLFTDKGEMFRSLGIYLPPFVILIRILIVKDWSVDYKDELLVLLVALCLSAIISSIFTQNMTESFAFFKSSYLKVFLVFIGMSFVFSEQIKLTRLVTVLAFLSLFFTIITFYDFSTKAFVTEGIIDYAGAVRKYSVPLQYLLPFVPCAFVFSKSAFSKVLWVVVLSLGIIAVLLTGARGAWFGLLFSLIIWLAYYYLDMGRLKGIIVAIAGIALLSAIVIQIIPESYINKQFKKKLYSASRLGMTWRASVENYLESDIDKKIIGKGLDKKIMYDDFDKWLEKNRESVRFKKIAKNPHNMYLFLLYKQGLLGLSIYVALIIVVILKLNANIIKRKSFVLKSYGIAVISCLAGTYAVRGMVEDLPFVPLGFLLGLAGAYLNIAKKTDETTNNLSCT